MDNDSVSILRSRFSLENLHADFRKRLTDIGFEDGEIDYLVMLLSEYITDYVIEEISNALTVEDLLVIDRNSFTNNLSNQEKAEFIVLFFEEKTGSSIDSLTEKAMTEFVDNIFNLESQIKKTIEEHPENPERFLNQLILETVKENE